MGVKKLLNKKLIMLSIFIVSLFAISVVSAADNVTDDVVGVEETTDEVMLVNNESAGELKEGSDNAVGIDESVDALNEDVINAKIEVMNSENEYQNGAFKFKVTDIDNPNMSLEGKTLSLSTFGSIKAGFSTVIDENNIASFNTTNLYEFYQSPSLHMKKLEVGNHAVEVSTSGDLNATPLILNLTITKANINIKIDDIKEQYGTNKNITITVTNKKDGAPVPGIVLHLYMPQTSGKDFYFQTDSNGQSKVTLKSLVSGTYDVIVKNNDTKNINGVEESNKVIIVPVPIRIVIPDVSVFYSRLNLTFKVMDMKSKSVSGAIVLVSFDDGDSKNYLLQSDENGIVSFVPSLSAGNYHMKISSMDSRYISNSVTKDIIITNIPGDYDNYDDDYDDYDEKEKIEIIVEDIDFYYSTTYSYIVSLADESGYPIDDVNELRVVYSDGDEEIGEFDEDGDYLFSMDKIANRKATFYLIDSNYKADPVTINVKISKSPVKISTKVYYSNTKQYSILKAIVKDVDGEPIDEGKVKFNINGKSYYSNVKNGIATKKIKLTKAKTYTYSATYIGNDHYKNSKTSSSKIYVYSSTKKDRTFSVKGYKFTLTQNQYNKLINAKNTGKTVGYNIKTNKKVKQTITKNHKNYRTVKAIAYAYINYGGKAPYKQTQSPNKYTIFVETKYTAYVTKGKLMLTKTSSTINGLKSAKVRDMTHFRMI